MSRWLALALVLVAACEPPLPAPVLAPIAPVVVAPVIAPVVAAVPWHAPPVGWREDCWLADAPCRFTVDVDGDGAPDRVRLVASAAGKRGIAMVLSSGPTVFAGAGSNMGNGGDDFAWADAWRIASAGELPRGAKGAGVLVQRSEAGGGVIAWDGSKLQWTQHGD